MEPSLIGSKDLLIGKHFPQPDYRDVYSRYFESTKSIPVEEAVKAFFRSMPSFVGRLMALREKIAALLGLKTGNGKSSALKETKFFSGQPGDKIGLFEVWERTDQEILTGQRDKHLDFGLSFYLIRKDNQYTLSLITAVKIHNTLGKIYFTLVKPFHKLIMPFIINRIKGSLQKKL